MSAYNYRYIIGLLYLANNIYKAKEGDKKVIFGHPATYTVAGWVLKSYYKRIGEPGNYRYFQTQEEWDNYLKNQNKDDDIKDKSNEEEDKKDISDSDLMKFTLNAIIGDGKKNKEVFISKISPETKDRLNKKFGIDANDLATDVSSLRLAYLDPKHNLEIKDILLAREVIETTTNIIPAGESQNNSAYRFTKDIDGEITFVVEARKKKKKLVVFNFWRKKKKRQRPDDAS